MLSGIILQSLKSLLTLLSFGEWKFKCMNYVNNNIVSDISATKLNIESLENTKYKCVINFT